MVSLLEPHQIAAHFPEMSADDMAALVIDIKANGLQEPIMLFEGKILDGRHRYKACLAANVEVRTERFDGTHNAAFLYAYSRNVPRRHLRSKDKRGLIKNELERDAGRSDRAIAQKVGVHHSTVAAARDGGEFSHHEKRVGKDGVAQPAKKRGVRPGAKAREERVAEIRALVASGNNVDQIAADQGVSVQQVRNLMTVAGIRFSMPAKAPTIKVLKIANETVTIMAGVAHGLQIIRGSKLDISREAARSMLEDLTPALKHLRWFEHSLKEIVNG